MIDFGLFQFASAPRTASTWFTSASKAVGLCDPGRVFTVEEVHAYFPQERTGVPRITLVRHPVDWLASFFSLVYPAPLGLRSDRLCEFCHRYEVDSFDRFLELSLDWYPGIVGQFFADYDADIVLRTDRISEGFCQVMESMGIDNTALGTVRNMPPANVGLGDSPIPWDPVLRERFLDSEQEMMDRYGFEREATPIYFQ